MQRDLIGKILKYGFLRYKDEIPEAMADFFEGEEYAGNLNENKLAYLNEWFIFDCKFSDGKSFLESYIEKNRYFLSEEMNECLNLLENKISIFQVFSVLPGNSMTVCDIYSKKEYFILEKQGTQELKKNDLILCRIGKVGDYYEIAGSQMKVLANTKDDKGSLEHFQNFKEPTIKDMCDIDLFEDFLDEQRDKVKKMSAETSEEEMKSFLKRRKLDKFLSIGLLREWLLRYGEKDFVIEDINDITSVIFTLAASIPENDFKEKLGDEDIEILQNFYNTSPQGKIGGLSPLAKAKSDINGFGCEGFASSSRSIGLFGMEALAKGTSFLKEGRIKEAKKSFESGLLEMLNTKTVIYDPYRAFVNIAICFLRDGKLFEAEQLVKLALDINSNYTFGKKIMSRIQNGDFDYMYSAKKGKTKDILKGNPALLYYDFLKKLKINFKSKEGTIDKIFTVNKKISKNS